MLLIDFLTKKNKKFNANMYNFDCLKTWIAAGIQGKTAGSDGAPSTKRLFLWGRAAQGFR